MEQNQPQNVQQARTERVLNEADRILRSMQTPQAIRELPAFDGNSIKLHSFIKSVENLLPFIDVVEDTHTVPRWLAPVY